MLSGGAMSSSSPVLGAQPAQRPLRRSSVPAGLHEALSDVLQDQGVAVGASKAKSAAEARQRRASGMGQAERHDALFGGRSQDSMHIESQGSVASVVRGQGSIPFLQVSSRGSATSPVQRFASRGSMSRGSASVLPTMGRGLSLGGRPFCAPKDDVGSLYLRIEAVKRNAERNKQELAANRTFMDEVQALEALGRAARAQSRREAGLPEEEDEDPEHTGVPEPAAKSTHRRADALRENALSNGKVLEWNRMYLDDLLVFAGRKEAQAFDSVNFSKCSGLGKFALPQGGGETSTPLRLDAMSSTLTRNESRLRDHSALMDEMRTDWHGKQVSRRAASAPEAAAPARLLGSPSASPSASPGSTVVVDRTNARRPTGSLASRLDAVADAARSNAMELRQFRGTIAGAGQALHALRDSEALSKTSPPVERIFCSGQLRPARSTGRDRSKEIKTRVEAMTMNASRNFENLSQQREVLNQALRAGTAEGKAESCGSSPAPPTWRSGGFGVKA